MKMEQVIHNLARVLEDRALALEANAVPEESCDFTKYDEIRFDHDELVVQAAELVVLIARENKLEF